MIHFCVVSTAYPLKKMSHRHQAVLTWLIANPHRSLKECAADLHYTPEWVRILVNTDIFQAHYRERCAEVGAIAAHDFENRIRGIAALAIEKTEERLSSTRVDPATGKEISEVSDRFLADVTKNVLTALGYVGGNREPDTSTHLHIQVNEDDLREARARANENIVDVTAESGN